MPRDALIVGNWKMNGTLVSARALTEDITERSAGMQPTIVLCPPAIHIRDVAELTKAKAVQVGAQDCHAEEKGAFTGSISASMLKDLTCQYVIVGHSERRAAGETSADVKAKAEAVLQQGYAPHFMRWGIAGDSRAG